MEFEKDEKEEYFKKKELNFVLYEHKLEQFMRS